MAYIKRFIYAVRVGYILYGFVHISRKRTNFNIATVQAVSKKLSWEIMKDL